MHLVVSVESPAGRRLVSVPDDAPVESLVPALVEELEGGGDAAGWSLAPQGEPALDSGQTLAGAGLFPGAVLVLMAPPRVVHVPTTPPPPPIESMNQAEYLRLLDSAIGSRHARPSTVIAVLATQPGAGATTVATAHWLARSIGRSSRQR